MKQRKRLVFAIFVFLVAGYAGYDYWSSQKEEKQKSDQRQILSLQTDQVQKITVQTEKEKIELERTVDGWKMTQPVSDRADSRGIEQYLEGIATERAQETVTEGENLNLAGFGLDHPKGVVTLALNSGSQETFAIGKMKNYQGDAYLRRNDEKKVWIASSTWFAKVEKTALDFRDKRLMRRSNAKTERIWIEKGGEKIELIKKDGNWILAAHPDWAVDQNKVREVLAGMNATEALEFISESDATPAELQKWGLTKPAVKVRIEAEKDADLKPWSVEVASGPDKVTRARTSDPLRVVKISPTDFGRFLALDANFFRDTETPFRFDSSKVKKIKVQLGQQEFEFKPEDERGKGLLAQLSKMKATDFVEPKAVNFEQRISFQDEAGNDLFTFQWGDLRQIQTSQGEKSVYTVKTSAFPKRFSLEEVDINNLNLNELKKKESAK